MSVQSVFDKYAAEYDASRKRLIPCFDDFYSVAISEIPFPEGQKINVLDLGAGTGLVARLVAARYPTASISLIDVAENMLAEAERKLQIFPNEFSFIAENYVHKRDLGNNFDLIISALSIHHLSGTEKRELFRVLYANLKPGGIFINADQVLGVSQSIDDVYRQRWLEQIRANGVTEEELHGAFERMKEDKFSTLADQLQWLKDAGFVDVECWYKSYSFVVFSGRKEMTP